MSENIKYRLLYTKQGDLRFIGHLDTLRLFERTVKKSRLPVAHSEGFNPHLLLFFALPLPLGVASANDVLEICLEHAREPDEIVSCLNRVLPDGIRITYVRKMDASEKKASSMIDAADYTVEIFGDLSQESLITAVDSADSRGRQMADMIHEIKYSDNLLFLKLAAGSRVNLKPTEVLGILGCEFGTVSRTALYAKSADGNGFIEIR